ncbi:MAG: 1-deoxy-D-xylulose-5-phosphate reductoisomerase [Deltaproteobacteria bacterium]
MKRVKRLAVFGSTGSIGKNTLDVVRDFPDRFRVESLCAHSNIEELAAQVKVFRPRKVCVGDPSLAHKLAGLCGRVEVLSGEQGLKELAADTASDTVVMAITGAAALAPVLEAVGAGKAVCLANKEALVMAGPTIMDRARRKGARIVPVDSEQSAIWQCLNGEDRGSLRRIYLTASGGPFLGWDRERLSSITREDALRHPRWKMGRKITVDSATLMNKGLEVIEAMHLFGVTRKEIEVVVHPESVIHSMVEFRDGVVMAQMSVPDMRIPILYALSSPDRLPSRLAPVDFFALGALTFKRPDLGCFPCLKLAYEAAEAGGTAPCVLNAANEVGVEHFMKGKLGFLSIARCVEKVLERHRVVERPSVRQVFEADSWARETARALLETI